MTGRHRNIEKMTVLRRLVEVVTAALLVSAIGCGADERPAKGATGSA